MNPKPSSPSILGRICLSLQDPSSQAQRRKSSSRSTQAGAAAAPWENCRAHAVLVEMRCHTQIEIALGRRRPSQLQEPKAKAETSVSAHGEVPGHQAEQRQDLLARLRRQYAAKHESASSLVGKYLDANTPC